MSASRSVAATVCLLLLAGTATAPAAAVTGVDHIARGTAVADVPAPVVESTTAVVQANNTTRHRNPNGPDREGDLAAVRDHLAAEMGRVIVDCSQAVRVGELDPCEELNGTYRDALSKYVEVSREAGSSSGQSTRSFRKARRESREYTRSVRQFRESYREYQEARANGNVSRARRAARELRELSEETSRTGGNLSRSLRNVTSGGTDVRSAGQAINETTENVTRSVESIEQEVFVETNATARLDVSVGSFRDPLVVTGRITTVNGTAVPDARVGVSSIRNGSVGERVRASTRTNATGHYRLVYRPVTVATGRGSFAVRLLPSAASPYLPSNATVTALVEQVDADLVVDSVPSASAYGDRLRVRTRVTVGDVPVDRLPVATRIGPYRIGRGPTDERGEAVPNGRFPAVVEPGERTLVVGFELPGRAIAPVTESVELDVRETATVIEATARPSTDRSVVFEGRLTTGDGRPLENRTVRVAIAGRSIGTLRPGRNGSFGGNLTVPASVLPAEGSAERSVRLAFDGSGTNLASTETTVSVTLLAPADGSALPVDDAELSLSLIALLLAAVAGVVLLGRRSPPEERLERHRTSPDEHGTAPEQPVDTETVLEGIRAAMDAGDYDLVTTAGYRAIRRALARRVAAPPEATHWEFYGACAADGFEPDHLDAVRRLTERFERVAFASEGSSRSVAAGTLADVERLLEERIGAAEDPGRAGSPDGAGGPGAPRISGDAVDAADTDRS